VIHYVAAGDLNINDGTVQAGGNTYDYTNTFMDVAHILSDADIASINFEGNFYGEPYGSSNSAPQTMATALQRAGVDLVQLANSYAIYRGTAGLFSTVNGMKDAGLTPVGDFRLNITNSQSVATWEGRGLEEMILSPELTLPQMRDARGNTAAIVYGRIPLMLLEKCVASELTDCKSCTKCGARMVDRKGITFPVLREWEHRSVVYNSLPTVMSDREDQLLRSGLRNWHFLFSTETPREVDAVIEAYRSGAPMSGAVRRM
jgi:hypothetical protein